MEPILPVEDCGIAPLQHQFHSDSGVLLRFQLISADISSAAPQASQTVLCPANFTSFHRHLGTICRTQQNRKDVFPSVYPREAENTRAFPVQIFSRLSGTSAVGQRLKGQVRAADMLGFSCNQLSLHQTSTRSSLLLQ